jgi:lipooligosaccharide transport system permease protein
VTTEAIATAAPRRRRRLHRLERSALAGVLVREVINFGSYWRSSTFGSIVQPLIYLLAFGFGFGSLVKTVGGRDYVEFVATGTVATAVLFSSVFPAMFGTFVKYKFQRTYDAILAAPVDTEELVTAETLWIAARAGAYGCMPIVVGLFFGLNPSWGMLTVPFIGFLAGLGWAAFGVIIAAVLKSIDDFSYVTSTVITPLFLVAGTFFPISGLPEWAQHLAQLNPLYHTVQLVRHAAFGFDAAADLWTVAALLIFGVALVHHASFGFKGWVDVGHLAFLVAFALVTWRLAIHYMIRRVID